MNEDKATRYHRLGRRASILSTLWAGVILCVLMFAGVSVGVRDWASNATAGSPVLTVGLYVLILSAVFDVATLPFSLYREFLLERRYGLATQTVRHWMKDHVKGAFISLLFAEVGATFVYVALRRWPGHWWMVAGAGYSVFVVILVNAAPIVLLPLFYTFKPLSRAALRDRLTALASKTGARIMGVYEWTLSDRTKKANAALAGIGNTRRILLSDTLLSEYSDDEIEVILAHELAHHVHRDIWTSVVQEVALAFAGFFAANQVLQRSAAFFRLNGAADPAGIPLLLMTAGALGLAVKPILNAISRSHERRADAYALRMTNNPPAFISAMRRLGQQNLAEDSPSKLVQVFFYTHPPINERVQAARYWGQ
jgi:STE24 endopeptidase